MIHLTQQNFYEEINRSKMPILIEVSSVASLPVELTEKHQGTYKFCRVDVNAQAALAKRFDLLRIPTSILMHDGEIVQRICGAYSEEEWEKILNLN